MPYFTSGELRYPDHKAECALNILEGENTKCSCPTIESVTKEFGKAYELESHWKNHKDDLRAQFFVLLKEHISTLARTTVYYDGDDPDQHIATLYPKWRILKKDRPWTEWRILIEEDPEKKSWLYVNPLDHKAYQRTVAESAPQLDLERMKREAPTLYRNVTFQPKAPRELKPLNKLSDKHKDKLKAFLLPPKLTNRMEKPRQATAEELEGLE